jgi:hypothetical protein
MTSGHNKRFTQFAKNIGLGKLRNGQFTGDTPELRKALQNEVFNSALAYAAANGHKGDILNVYNNLGPGFRTDLPVFGDIGTPTFWESYSNISGWVVDNFISEIEHAVAAE